MLRVSFVVRSTEILPVFLGLPSLCFHVAEPTRKSACRLPQICAGSRIAPEFLSQIYARVNAGSAHGFRLPNSRTRRPNLRANQRWLDDEVKHGSDLPKPAPRSRAKQQVPAANQGLSRIYALVRDRADTPINGFGLPNRRIRGGQAPKLLPLTLPRRPD